MTPGAGTAQSVGRVGCRQMWRGDGRFVVLYWPVRGVARRGAIYDARCRNGTIRRPRWASAYVACCGRFAVLLRPVHGFVAAGSRHCVGRPGVTSGVRAFAGRSNVVLCRPVCGFVSVIRASQVAPLRLGVVECCFAVVIRASRVAPLRLRRLTVVWRWLVRGVARRGAIYDARCWNGTIRRPCGFFEPSGKGGLHSGGFPEILCFQIVVPHVCITFAA